MNVIEEQHIDEEEQDMLKDATADEQRSMTSFR